MTPDDLQAIWLTALLAGTTTMLLVPIATPLAWWLVRSTSPVRPVLEAVVALPLVLPPTVLGFYLLVMLNPTAPVGPKTPRGSLRSTSRDKSTEKAFRAN